MSQTEKGLLAFAIAALVAAIASVIFLPQYALHVLYVLILSQVLLLGFYIVNSTLLLYRIIFIAFIVGWVGTLLRLFHEPSWQVVYSVKYFAELILGILMLAKIARSYGKDGFQLYPFLLGILLILPALYSLGLVFHLMPGDQGNLSDVLYIPLIGVIFTLMSNNNLWGGYKKEEQYAITYMLIVIILPVAQYFIEQYIQ